MSRGAGRIEREIETALQAEPDRSFSIEDLCVRAYPGLNRIGKKHTFAVSRSLRAVVSRRLEFGILKLRARGNPLIAFTRSSLASVKHATTRGQPISRLTRADFAVGGPWDRVVALVIAQNTGDAQAVKRAIERVRANMSAAYVVDHHILDALFGITGFDRLLEKHKSP